MTLSRRTQRAPPPLSYCVPRSARPHGLAWSSASSPHTAPDDDWLRGPLWSLRRDARLDSVLWVPIRWRTRVTTVTPNSTDQRTPSDYAQTRAESIPAYGEKTAWRRRLMTDLYPGRGSRGLAAPLYGPTAQPRGRSSRAEGMPVSSSTRAPSSRSFSWSSQPRSRRREI